ncbi:ankyrin repeat-containing domain protein [Nemania sp. NC0429]|nr:ankyrin repeat-containing domain protein [Nemania sp. NC0429]
MDCDNCGRICPSLTALRQHKRCHTKGFLCMKEPCLRKSVKVAFSTRRDLIRHQDQVHGKKGIRCPYCCKPVKRQDNLGRHIAKLHGEELLTTAMAGDEAMIRRVLDKGMLIESRNMYGQTMLSQAAESGSEAVVKLLLGKGAKINARDFFGRSPLHRAASNGHVPIVKLLLSKGANIM